ncbi:MAG: AI-2E family transporter, partial [Alphaproteobacteria bacterium]|nr:AI-2E family transporter [Alphaproteobacteria bacterium]
MFAAHTKKIWFWLGVGVAFLGFLYLIRTILLPFVLGLLVAYFLDPAARWLERRGYSRTTATSILIVGFFGGMVLVIAALAPVLYDQIMAFFKALPEYLRKGKEFIAPQIDKVMSGFRGTPVAANSQEVLSNASESALEYAKTILVRIFTSGANFFNTITLLLLAPVVAFYLLRDWQEFIQRVDELLPRESADTIREQMREIDNTIAGYLRGQVNVCLILAAFYMVGLGLTGLNYGVLIGLISGLITFIPFVGAMLGFIAAMAIALFQFDEFWRIAAVAIVYGLGQMQ